jgi:hypothetical protein
MSKKLLNESTIRRFAGLAGIGADVVSNFINEALNPDVKEAILAGGAVEVERGDLPRPSRESYSHEESFRTQFPDGVGGLEISDPSMPNWNQNEDQIVYQGGDGRDHYFKVSTDGAFYKVPAKMQEGVVSEEEESEEMDMEMDAGDEEADMDMEMGAGDEEAEMDMDMDAGAEGGDDAEALVSDIVAKLQDLAKMAGVDIDVEMGDEEEAEELEEMDAAYERDDEVMEEEEETLEEIINGILAEEEEELEEAKDEEMEEGLYGDGRHTKKESKDPKQEEVVQEVLRRVRERLAQKTKQ